MFGISCNRQIASSLLTHKGKEVTRGTVQKAVVVLAREVSAESVGDGSPGALANWSGAV